MGKLTQFGLLFNEERAVYFPGNTISGQLVVQLSSPMEMKAIRIKFVGRAHVHWTERHSTGSGKNRRTTTRHYSATENLFQQAVNVHGEGINNQNTLPQGHHVFPFQFQLPAPLPSSYEDHVGYIRYHIKGTIDKPWKFDHNTKRAFTVLDSLDLNAISSVMSPSGGQDSKHLCCLCCQSGPIEMEFHTDRSGYVPGEYILLNGTITNSSNSKVEASSAQLIKRVTYHATSKSKTVCQEVARINGPPVPKHGSVTWTNERLHIPPLPPSEVNHCRIIDIVYFVQFQAHLRACAIDLRADCGMTIGTIPLQSLDLYRNATPSEVPSAPSLPLSLAATAPPAAPQPLGFAPTQYSHNPPPPSYAAATGEEAYNIKDEDDNEYTMGETSYKPQYTYYDWNESAFTYN
ncbi:arrestin domain-containing protein 17-like [Styela clava]